MAGRWMYFYGILMGILITHTQSSEENCNSTADIVITDSEALKKIEIRNTPNITSTLLPTPTIVQQGSNIFIKPKFILGSPFTSYKHGSADGGSMTSKIPSTDSKTMIVQPEIPQLPTMVVPPAPPVVLPTGVVGDIPIPPPIIENELQVPFAVPNICHSLPCPPDVVPISPYFPQLLNSPILVEKPEPPIFIPEPPQLPPATLPQLPIQVIVQRPNIPIPDRHIIISNVFPQMGGCNTNGGESSVSSIFNDIVQKFKNMMNPNSENSSASNSTTATPDTTSTVSTINEQSEIPLAYPTICAQGIIAERYVPNMVTDDEVKVYMIPISPSQLAHFNYYRK